MKHKQKIIIGILFATLIFSACANENKSSAPITQETTMNRTLQLTVNGTTLTAKMYDNSSVVALFELIASQGGTLTIKMRDYSNFEKVGSLPKALPRNDTPTDTDYGDLILYQGNQFVIYYDQNSWNFTPLGKIQNVSQSELKNILGSGDVTVVLSAE